MGVGNDRRVYYRVEYKNNDYNLEQLSPPLGGIKHVSVGASGVWAVHHDGRVFYQETHLSSSRKPIAGRLYQISANSRGYVYGVNKDGEVVYRVENLSDISTN